MDFQGQGLASTGETEALALIDSFTKIVTVIPLPDRQVHTLVPKLLDAIYFTRGAPDVIHSDDAPEFLSELMSAIAAATGTLRTTTCGHNPQSNGEIESWWRFWNRAMRFLSPHDYLNWPRFAQRICFAYNSVDHESIGPISPFEMDHGTPPKLPFACRFRRRPANIRPCLQSLRIDSQNFHGKYNNGTIKQIWHPSPFSP